ncbi:MAG: hypothetical protein ACFFB3_15760 [Candidatus Hodarchaeota archaeon]
MALSDLKDLGILAGLTSIVLVIISFVLGLYFIIRSFEGKNFERQRFLTGIGIIGLGGTWFGGVIQFLLIILTGDYLDVKLHTYLIAWAPALASLVWIFLVFSLVKPEWRNYAMISISIVTLAFLIFTYGLVSLGDIETSTRDNGETKVNLVDGISEQSISNDSGFPNQRYLGIPGLIIALYVVLLILLVGGVFLWTSIRTQSLEIKWKARLVGFGVVVYGFIATIDAFLDPIAVVIILTRFLIICSFFLIALGYTLPKWFRSRIGVHSSS